MWKASGNIIAQHNNVATARVTPHLSHLGSLINPAPELKTVKATASQDWPSVLGLRDFLRHVWPARIFQTTCWTLQSWSKLPLNSTLFLASKILNAQNQAEIHHVYFIYRYIMNTNIYIYKHILPRHSQILRVSGRFVGRFVVTSFFVVRGRPRAKSLPTVSGYGACTSVQRIIISICTVILKNIVHATICYHALNGSKNLLRERFGYDWGGEVLFQVHSYISCLASVRKKINVRWRATSRGMNLCRSKRLGRSRREDLSWRIASPQQKAY